MDVKYRPEPWQNMGDGMNRITKDALIKLQRANELLKKIDGRIRDLDSDGSIHFNPKDQSQKIGELLDSYSTLQRYCGEAGRLVSEHIDKPFLVEMDKFAQKMRDTSILSFETDNRIGSTTTTVLPDAHAGYGSVPQTIKTKKDKITVEDIFRDSPAFDNVLREEYKELKKQNPDAKLNYEEYKKVVPSTRGFEYKSIEDEQKKLEMVRDIGIGLGIIITTILCPPLGTAAAVVYGAVQIKSGIDGEDWGTHRKLSQEERVGNIIFGGLDAIPVVGAVGKGVKAFKDTSELADLAKLLKYKEGMPGFNPNLGGNVVQSLKENNLLKNLKIQGWKTVGKINDADYFIKGLVAKGVDSVTPFAKGVEIMPDGSVVRSGTNYSGKFQEAHDASKASIQSRISNLESGGVKGTGSNVNPNKITLTQEREKYYRKKIDEAKARGDYKAADDIRYDRHCEETRQPLERKDWDARTENLRKSQERGREEEIKGRKALGEHLNRTLEDNNSGKVVTYTSSEGHLTRPDSIGRNAKDEIDLVHDHKHKISDKEHVIHNDSQMRAEREMLEDKSGSHIVTISSDKPDLNGIPPHPRPSGPLAKESDIFYTDPNSGKVTHKWETHPDIPGGGIWIKI
ncbi:ADP-ribosyltransferase [Bacillus wiedmannii]|uniref:ADP-ribosyltransferase n=1 Tax=Bacillus TaxID=1386 RepID=UPI000BF851F6|nr:ADP-ribosyltransferase [Bacillus wiedmannii]PEP51719.1 ADP-ribosyltransferase [Bacillus wiedmannii]PFZ55462.1 ADP-ribosyltransferase [Bacillus wiedmannii]PGD97484.1 ADP-ribosyltransferase [Bacillus wiedmannii]PGE33567.1 ADP-ribosyltransferase [Bacillus wiedmannii]PHA34634.1 ADP-ribosyltransferase [Bacillus wiedmannii]